MTKALLDSRHVYYIEIRIDQDEKAAKWFKKQKHTTVPQIYFEDKIFVEGGFAGLLKMNLAEFQAKLM